MPYGGIPPPPMVPEMVIENTRADEIERREGSADDVDQMRDEPASTGHGGWLVVLVAILGIAGLFILLYLLAGIL